MVARHPLAVPDRPENAFYLAAKRVRMGHDTGSAWIDVWRQLTNGGVPPAPASVELFFGIRRPER